MNRRPVIICFAGDSWDGNPHSRHHLALRLRRDFEVLFVEGIPMRALVGQRHELRRIARKVRPRARLRTVAEGLHVLRPPPVPPAGAFGWRALLHVVAVSVRRACDTLNLQGPRLTWFSQPLVAPLLGRLGDQASVLYYQDRYDAFSHVNAPRLQRCLAELAQRCDLAVATSEPLAMDLRRLGARPEVIPHGVDAARFAAPDPAPADLVALEAPIVGFVGIIDDYLDVEAIVRTANELEVGTLVLVGPVNTDVARLRHPRIVLLGARPYGEIPSYVGGFDCCLIPFARNDLTVGVNPIKLREYLAAGRPVVATALPPIRPYGDVVELVEDPSEFPAAVLRVLGQPENEATQAARQVRVERESWDAIAEGLASRLHVLLAHA